MGRKRKKRKLKVVSFRIEPELYSQLKRMKKYSSLIRNAVKKAIENYE
jgi:predicted DNA-binding protein